MTKIQNRLVFEISLYTLSHRAEAGLFAQFFHPLFAPGLPRQFSVQTVDNGRHFPAAIKTAVGAGVMRQSRRATIRAGRKRHRL